MSIVVDASVLVMLASGDPRREAAQTHLREWIAANEDMPAPALLPYEVANGLTRLVAGGLFPSERKSQAGQTLLSLPIIHHPLTTGGDRVVEVALEMRRRSACDAVYIVLAQLLGAGSGPATAQWPEWRGSGRHGCTSEERRTHGGCRAAGSRRRPYDPGMIDRVWTNHTERQGA